MRFSINLYAQHLGWTFKKHWRSQGIRVTNESVAIKHAEKLGRKVNNGCIIEQKTERTVGLFDTDLKVAPHDSTYPNWQAKSGHIYESENVLLQDIKQGQILTKTVVMQSLPKMLENSFSNLQVTTTIDKNICKIIMASHVLDAEQFKIPRARITERPSRNMNREYGISNQRRSYLLVNRLLMECAKLADGSAMPQNKLLDQVNFSVTLSKNEDILQFNIRAHNMLTSAKPLELIKGVFEKDIPDMFPLKYTISMPKKRIYASETSYPLSNRIADENPHTIFTFWDKELVGNLYGAAVTHQQFQSRTLLNAFVVSAARAKQLYGDYYKGAIPKPIVVQSVHTDGRTFHFGVFQLNTLALNNKDGLKNYWSQTDNMDLFTSCGYNCGRPYLEGYNKNVFRIFNAMYHNA